MFGDIFSLCLSNLLFFLLIAAFSLSLGIALAEIHTLQM